jgi:hypothetical protein
MYEIKLSNNYYKCIITYVIKIRRLEKKYYASLIAFLMFDFFSFFVNLKYYTLEAAVLFGDWFSIIKQ